MVLTNLPQDIRIINEYQLPSDVKFVDLSHPEVETRPFDTVYSVLVKDRVVGELIPKYGRLCEVEYEGHIYSSR